MDSRTENIDMSRFRQMYLVVSALPTVLPLLTFVFWFMGSGGWDSEPGSVSGPLVLAFAAAALVSVPLGLWLRGRMLGAGGPGAVPVSGSAREHTPAAGDAAVMRIQQAVLVGMAGAEPSLLLGFVLGFIAQSWWYYIVFASYTVFGWAIAYPRPSQVRQWYATLTGVQPSVADRQPGML